MNLENLIRPAVIHSAEAITYANQEFCRRYKPTALE